MIKKTYLLFFKAIEYYTNLKFTLILNKNFNAYCSVYKLFYIDVLIHTFYFIYSSPIL